MIVPFGARKYNHSAAQKHWKCCQKGAAGSGNGAEDSRSMMGLYTSFRGALIHDGTRVFTKFLVFLSLSLILPSKVCSVHAVHTLPLVHTLCPRNNAPGVKSPDSALCQLSFACPNPPPMSPSPLSSCRLLPRNGSYSFFHCPAHGPTPPCPQAA
jgi:hypothetical protein